MNGAGDLPNPVLLAWPRAWLSHAYGDLPTNYKTTENVTFELERVSLAAVNVTSIPQI
jgi:hypothetical protein